MNNFGMGLSMWIFWIFITVVIVLLVMMLMRENYKNNDDNLKITLEMLETRYANGDIGKDAYERTKKALKEMR